MYQRFLKKGKKKADQPLFKNESYVKAIMKAGQVWTQSDLTFIATEALIFHLYGRKYQSVLLRKGPKQIRSSAFSLCRPSSESYVKAIVKTRQMWTLSDLTFITMEALVFHMYGRKYQKVLLCKRRQSRTKSFVIM